MNGNLSKVQTGTMPSMTNSGAMPIKVKFDGPPPIKEQTQRGVMQPNREINIPKPGFF